MQEEMRRQEVFRRQEEMRRRQEEFRGQEEFRRRPLEGISEPELGRIIDELRRIKEQIRQMEVIIIRRFLEMRERRSEIGNNNIFNENQNEILRQLPISKLQNIDRLNGDSKKCIICLEDFKNND